MRVEAKAVFAANRFGKVIVEGREEPTQLMPVLFPIE
jgi:hypothetical protein